MHETSPRAPGGLAGEREGVPDAEPVARGVSFDEPALGSAAMMGRVSLQFSA